MTNERERNAAYQRAFRARQSPERLAELRKQQDEWRAAHPDVCRRASRKHSRKRAGVKDAHGETKHGPCDICTLPTSDLHLDHNHQTGEHRGWLCHNCNVAIGLLRESTSVLKSAIHYLETN